MNRIKKNWYETELGKYYNGCVSVRCVKLPAEDVDGGKKLKSWETRLVHGRRRRRRL